MPAAALGQRAVVADRDREEVVHQVRVGDLVVGAHEAARLEVVRRARPALAQQPLEPDLRARLHREVRRHRHRLRGGVLDVDLEMVLQVLPHAGQVGHDADAERLAARTRAPMPESWSSCGELIAPPQRITSPARTVSAAAPALARVLDPDGAIALEHDLRHERARLDLEVRAPHHRVQVRARGGQPAPVVHVAVELGEALLAVAVHVVGERVAGLLHGREEGVEQRAARRAALQHQRAVMSAERVVGRRREAVLHALEVRQAVGVVPRLHPGVRGPALVVHRVAALEDHPVDRARPAEHLAARVVDAPAAHVRLRLGLVLPVVEAAADRERQRGRHVDEDVPEGVVAPGLEHEDPIGWILREPVRQSAAGGPSTDDDEIVLGGSHRADISQRGSAANTDHRGRHPAGFGIVGRRLAPLAGLQRSQGEEQQEVDREPEHGAELRLHEGEHLGDEDRDQQRALELAIRRLAAAAPQLTMRRTRPARRRRRST